MLIFFFCDRSFKLNGIWPNLEEAKKSNQRIFAFVRVDNELEIKYLGDKIIPEIKVKKDDIANHDVFEITHFNGLEIKGGVLPPKAIEKCKLQGSCLS